jgi:hypothetical protein
MYSPKLPEAMEQLSMGRIVIYEQIRAGRLRTVTQGRTRLVPGTAIADYVALLERDHGEGFPFPRHRCAPSVELCGR